MSTPAFIHDDIVQVGTTGAGLVQWRTIHTLTETDDLEGELIHTYDTRREAYYKAPAVTLVDPNSLSVVGGCNEGDRFRITLEEGVVGYKAASIQPQAQLAAQLATRINEIEGVDSMSGEGSVSTTGTILSVEFTPSRRAVPAYVRKIARAIEEA